MKKLLSASQMKAADTYTIQNRPIASKDLMMQASLAFVNTFAERFDDKNLSIAVFCGTGNNGGDGLVIADLLYSMGYKHISLLIVKFSDRSSNDFDYYFNKNKYVEPVLLYHGDEELPEVDILIDAILGSGQNRALEGAYAKLVTRLNNLNATVVAVDVPTGFRTEGRIGEQDAILKADWLITFERAKLNYLLPDASEAIKGWTIVDIGLDQAFIEAQESPYYLIEQEDILSILKDRPAFSHKGTYGRSLIVAGALETMGAALLAAKSCVYAGSGLTTVCIPESGMSALNIFVPEAMAINRSSVMPIGVNWDRLTSVAIGPGIGIYAEELLLSLLAQYEKPIVFDADALNIMAANKSILKRIPHGSVLTPHVKEFDKLFGKHDNWTGRLETGRKYAQELNLIILLKNRYTLIFLPDGDVVINPSGSPAMSSGGMGDVLTGVITAFIAQGYSSKDAAILATYIHGYSGETVPGYVVPASKLIEQLPLTIAQLLRAKVQ